MSAETHVNALIKDTEEALQKAHGAIDDLKNAYDKVRQWYTEHGSEISEVTSAAEAEVDKVEKPSASKNS